MIVTIYNQNTNEVFACINTDKDSFIEKGYQFDVRENEPVFVEKNGKLYYDRNRFIVK